MSGRVPPAHMRYICSKIEALERGEFDRLLIACPPGHGKSFLTSHHAPAWIMSRNPDFNVIAVSHTDEFAEGWGRKVRNTIMSPEHGRLFDVRVSEDSRAAGRWDIRRGDGGYGGEYFAAGVGATITGKRADCLTGETLVHTERGQIPISDLVAMSDRPRVWSLDHGAGSVVLRRIVATRVSQSDALVEIQTARGRSLRCTRDHRVFGGARGYTRALQLREGDGLCVLGEGQSVQAVWRSSGARAAACYLSQVLFRGSESHVEAAVCAMLSGVRQAALRVREKLSERTQVVLLLAEVRAGQRDHEGGASVLDVHEAYKGLVQKAEVLLAHLSATIGEAHLWRPILPILRGFLPAYVGEAAVLHAGLRQRSALETHGRQRQFTVFASIGVERSPGAHEASDTGARWAQVRSVWARWEKSAGQAREGAPPLHAPCPPHRHQSAQQRAGEFGQSLQGVSQAAPRSEGDAVSVARELRCGSVPVYDIQVEGTHNFFANGILVHNCVIIDDPLRGIEDAESQTVRDNLWAWYGSDLLTRLKPRGRVIIVSTRWHLDDLSGRLLEASRSGRGDKWETVILPAEAEKNDPLGRAVGEPLWPSWQDSKALARIRNQPSMTSRMYAALYQQNPVVESGGIIDRRWFKLWQKRAAPKCKFVIQTWDTALTANDKSAYSASLTLGVFDDDHQVPNLILLSAWRGRVEWPDLRRMVVRMAGDYLDDSLKGAPRQKDPKDRVKPDMVLIEAKANGQALIRDLQRADITATPFNPDKFGDKIARVRLASDLLENGRVWLPCAGPDYQRLRPWADEFAQQCAQFPASQSRDWVDCLTMALLRIKQSGWVFNTDDGMPPPKYTVGQERRAIY